MADNYRLFSEEIGGITPEEHAWITQVLNCQGDVSSALKNAGIRITAIDPEWWPGFQWKIEEGELWLYSEESGAIEHVAEFVRAFLSRFRPKECWSMTWADTCFKPRIGEFSGGGIFVTATKVKYICLTNAMQQMHRRFETPALRRHSAA